MTSNLEGLLILSEGDDYHYQMRSGVSKYPVALEFQSRLTVAAPYRGRKVLWAAGLLLPKSDPFLDLEAPVDTRIHRNELFVLAWSILKLACHCRMAPAKAFLRIGWHRISAALRGSRGRIEP
jgi:hypothetical protein